MFGTWRTRDGDRVHGSGAFQFERLFVRVTRWRVILIGAAAAAYLLGLLIHLPAEAVVRGEREAVGTVWDGEAGLEPGFALGWRAAPLASLGAFAPTAQVAVRGPDTALSGVAAWKDGGMVMRDVQGPASLRLASALAPQLPLACDGEATVRAQDLALAGGGSGEGLIRTGPALCASGGATAALPPLIAQARSDAEGFSLSARDPAGGELLAARRSREGALTLTVTPAGAAALPGLPASTIEIR